MHNFIRLSLLVPVEIKLAPLKFTVARNKAIASGILQRGQTMLFLRHVHLRKPHLGELKRTICIVIAHFTRSWTPRVPFLNVACCNLDSQITDDFI